MTALNLQFGYLRMTLFIQRLFLTKKEKRRLQMEVRRRIYHMHTYDFRTYQSEIAKVRGLLDLGDFTLEDIGSSEGELMQLAKRHATHMAREFYFQLFRLPAGYKYCIESMRQHLAYCGAQLSDIYTSEDRIADLEQRAATRVVYQLLHLCRSGTRLNPGALQEFREHVRKSNKTLNDFGTSEEEIHSFME